MKGCKSVFCVKMISPDRCELTMSDTSSPSSTISVVIEKRFFSAVISWFSMRDIMTFLMGVIYLVLLERMEGLAPPIPIWTIGVFLVTLHPHCLINYTNPIWEVKT